MKIIASIVILAIVLVIAFLFFIYLGIYNVSAIEPHSRPIRWVMSTTMDNSVRRHAAGISAPPLTDADMVRRGAGYYQTSCATCHGAPGVARATFAKGLNPAPPSLAGAVSDWTPAELFWIVKNGVRMTGMPAFAPAYDEAQLWALIAFLQRLPALSPQDYQTLVKGIGAGPQ
ncbi:MAG: cytochrome c [Acidobacteriia bacterium]|nr:cytochrome c [Terriglobia bacterium]